MNTFINETNRAIAFILVLILVLTAALPIVSEPVYAAGTDIVDMNSVRGDVLITKSGIVQSAIVSGSGTVIATGTSITITGTTTDYSVTVSGAGVFDIVLSGASIKRAAKYVCALGSKNDAKLNLILKEGTLNELQSGGERAGLETGDRGLSISSIGVATLTAIGGFNGAGIGGRYREAGCNIYIFGGVNIVTRGVGGGTGIGGGGNYYGENISIYGKAKIIAEAGNQAAGIGSSQNSNVTNVSIFGEAEVIAKGGTYAAGIGGGFSGFGDTILIYDKAEVTAIGGRDGAGIGGGRGGYGKNISIYGEASVSAEGGSGGSGIGGGIRSSGENIKIAGDACVTASGGSSFTIAHDITGAGPGIGGGAGHEMTNASSFNPGAARNITIEGGFVTAKAGETGLTEASVFNPAFDIGGGSCSIGGITITEGFYISGGSVFVGNEKTGFGTTPKSIDGEDVFRVTVPAFYSVAGQSLAGFSLLGNKVVDIDLLGALPGKIYTAKTVSSNVREHGADFPSDASAYVYLPKGNYTDITVGGYQDAIAEVVTSASITTSLQNIINWGAATSLGVTPTKASIRLGGSVTFTTTAVTPSDAVKWEVSDGRVTVLTSHSAVIKPSEVGPVTVTAASIFDSSVYTTSSIEVSKGVSVVMSSPSAAKIKVGQTLSGSALTGVVSVAGIGKIDGTFTWTTDTSIVLSKAGVFTYPVLFTPTDTSKYTTISAFADVKVVKPTPPVQTTYITINGIAVPYTLNGSTIIINIDNNTANRLFDAAASGSGSGADAGNILVDVGQLENDELDKIEFIFTDVSGIDKSKYTGLTLKLGSDESITFTKTNLKEILKPGVCFTLDGSGSNTTFGVGNILSPGGSADYYSYLAPKHIEIPYTLKPGETADNLVIKGSDGNIVPRSWYADGKVHAQVYSEGTYEVSYQEPNAFTDVKQAWMKKPINYMSAREVIMGVGSGKFNPNGNITREDFVVMIMRSLALDSSKIEGTAKTFTDASKISGYAKGHIADASKLGIVGGDSKGNVNPKALISRQDMFTMLSRAAKKMNIIVEPVKGTAPSFSDWKDVANYAKPEIEDLAKLGLVKGDKGKINPRANATRAEASQFMYNILQYDMSMLVMDRG